MIMRCFGLTFRFKNFIMLLITGFVLISLLFLGYIISKTDNNISIYVKDGKIITILSDRKELFSFEKESVTYCFLPPYARCENIIQKKGDAIILTAAGNIMNSAQANKIEDVLIDNGTEKIPWRVCFMRPENINTIFINTEEEIERGVYSNAHIEVANSAGSISISDNNAEIKGRGNSTWGYKKKPYVIKFSKEQPLFGMNRAKKWVLLNNYREGTKILNQTAYSLGRAMGIAAPECHPVNIYVNGEYNGLYLACEQIDDGRCGVNLGNKDVADPVVYNIIDKGNIKGSSAYWDGKDFGFIIEVTQNENYDRHNCAFRIKNNTWVVNEPAHASIKQVEYIKNIIESTEKAILSNSADLQEKIDIDSFSKRYLLEEFIYNGDSAMSSYYFYKKKGDKKLYAGPCWDYDNGAGILPEGRCNPYGSVLDDWGDGTKLCWDKTLLQNIEYRQIVKNNLKNISPIIKKILSEFDISQKEISSSINLEEVRWGGSNKILGKYQKQESISRYTKIFLTEHYNSMCNCFGINEQMPSIPGNGQFHNITFLDENEHIISSFTVKDGCSIDKSRIPVTNKTFELEYGYGTVNDYMPILEDTSFLTGRNQNF